MNQDIDNFHKRIKLSSNFGSNDVNKKEAEEDTFKPSSNKNWLPKNTHYTIETFIDLKSKEIDKKKGNKIRHQNTTQDPTKGKHFINYQNAAI